MYEHGDTTLTIHFWLVFIENEGFMSEGVSFRHVGRWSVTIIVGGIMGVCVSGFAVISWGEYLRTQPPPPKNQYWISGQV